MLGYSCLLAWHGTAHIRQCVCCVLSVSRHLLNAVVVIEDMYVNVVNLVIPSARLPVQVIFIAGIFPS
jgi:hypothetical protein